MSKVDEDPISENLIKLIQQATEQYGSQKDAADAMGLTVSTLTRLLKGDTRFPSGRILRGLADFKAQADGRPWTTRQLMAWLWELPEHEKPPTLAESTRIQALFEDGIALLESGINTIALASEKMQAMGSQSSRVDVMCTSLVKILSAALRDRGLDLKKDKDYKKLCAILNAAPDEEAALRLRKIVLGQETAISGDRMIMARALQALGDTTPAHELVLDCLEC